MLPNLGCQWTLAYFSIGAIGGAINLLVTSPECYLILPHVAKVKGQRRVYLGFFGRVLVSGAAGCIADCNNVNAILAGFFAWDISRYASRDGWLQLKARLDALFKAK